MMGLSLELGLTKPKPVTDEGGGGGSSPYVAKAVHFDGANSALQISSLSSADSGLLAISFRFKAGLQPNYPGQEFIDANIFVSDPLNNYINNISLVDTQNTLAPFLKNSEGTATMGASSGPTMLNVWHHVLMSCDLNHADEDKKFVLYIDDVLITDAVNTNFGGAFILTLNDLQFNVGDDTYGGGFVGDLCDFWFAPGQFLHSPDGTILESVRRKFTDADNKPVDLGTDGSAPTGTQPTIFFSGDHSNFAVNKGTGGAFLIIGTLTNASSSPSD